MPFQFPMRVRSLDVSSSLRVLLSTAKMVVVDFEYLRGRQNEIVVKEVSKAGENFSDPFRFESP